MGIISAATATNLVADGAYVLRVAAPPNLAAGPATNVLAIVGTATDGKPNTPIAVSVPSGSASQLSAAVASGVANGALLPYSAVRTALNASPECTSFVIVRITDGTETSAVINITDASNGVVGTIIAINPGTNANGMTAKVLLLNGTVGSNPVYSVTIAYPNNVTQTYRVIGYATAGGAYNATAFWTNLRNAVNGTGPQTIANNLVVAGQPGVSTQPPSVGTVFTASGGSDGVANITTANFLGASLLSGSTGMYALKGTPFSGLVFAGCYDIFNYWAQMAAFLDSVGGIGFPIYPPSTTTTQAQGLLNSTPIQHARIAHCIDWDYFNDTATQQSSVLVEPGGAIAGIIMGVNPWIPVSNKPDGATKGGGLLGTEHTLNSSPIDPQTEGATRKTLGLQYLTNGSPRSNGLYGLAHGKASDGSNISDTRMFDYIAARALVILNRYVGKGQTPPVAAGAVDSDPTRTACNADFEKLKQDLLNPSGIGGQKLAAFRYVFVSTAAEVAAGRLRYQLFGTTLAGIEFAIGEVAVGPTVS